MLHTVLHLPKRTIMYKTLFFVCLSLQVIAQEATLIADWTFHPDYQLTERAANYPGPRLESPKSNLAPFGGLSYPFIFKGEEPTERTVNFLPVASLPKGPFTIEMWMVNHVNQPIGALLTSKSKLITEQPSWLLGYYGKELLFSLREADQPFPKMLTHTLTKRGWKKYWLHVVASYDGQKVRLLVNGEQVAEMPFPGPIASLSAPELELASYMNQEPYMQTANLVKNIRIYEGALTKHEVSNHFAAFQELVEKGHLFPNLFHFTAGPYLHLVTDQSINITWETDRALKHSIVKYGTELPFSDSLVVAPLTAEDHHIQEITLTGLRPAQPYFYEVIAVNQSEDRISSGVLTFATANDQPHPFTFAVIGDTEARPHVNFQVSQLIWDERPNFVVNLGDLTDGGRAPHKFEWTHEYFTGITPLASRIPMFPVAGNGEGDLYWYKRYHKLPEPEGYYTFKYGDAQFFMLDSNQKEEFAPEGKQYRWLEEQLKNSEATWKFVCHHHAPYSSDEDDYGNSWTEASNLGDLKVRQIVPLYEKYGIDIVFFGHLHTYQRTLPILEDRVDERNGVIYLQGGGGGGNLEDFTPTRSWFSAKTYRGHHYFTISILGDNLQMKMYDSDGNMKDFMEVKK